MKGNEPELPANKTLHTNRRPALGSGLSLGIFDTDRPHHVIHRAAVGELDRSVSSHQSYINLSKMKKYQLLASKGDEPKRPRGGALQLDEINAPEQIISAEYLHANTTERYFLKENDPEIEPREFVVVREISTGEWASEPSPHYYQIEFLDT